MISSNRVKMISPTIPASKDGKMCFSFWFAAFGAGDSTSLRIYKYEGKQEAYFHWNSF